MAIIWSMVIEVKGVGADYAGTAAALVLAISRLGNFVGPPVGNSLAAFHPGLPFVFWGALALFAPISLCPVKEQRLSQKMRNTASQLISVKVLRENLSTVIE